MACYAPVLVGILRKERYPGEKREQAGQMVPCGHCLGCRSDQARDWSIRIQHETQMHRHSWFLTLTYDEKGLPENGSLRPSDLQGFFKAMRRDHKAETISYFACGEYGDETQRPHYHAVLYGPPLLDRYIWRDDPGRPVWRSPALETYWKLGNSEFSTVTPASASYVAGYVRKKVRAQDEPDHYLRVNPDTGELVELEKIFARMSLRPAIGNRWIKKHWSDVYPKDFVVVDGKRFPPPRYYDKWMDDNKPDVMTLVRDRRHYRNIERDLEPDRLEEKRKNHEARNALFNSRSKL